MSLTCIDNTKVVNFRPVQLRLWTGETNYSDGCRTTTWRCGTVRRRTARPQPACATPCGGSCSCPRRCPSSTRRTATACAPRRRAPRWSPSRPRRTTPSPRAPSAGAPANAPPAPRAPPSTARGGSLPTSRRPVSTRASGRSPIEPVRLKAIGRRRFRTETKPPGTRREFIEFFPSFRTLPPADNKSTSTSHSNGGRV